MATDTPEKLEDKIYDIREKTKEKLRKEIDILEKANYYVDSLRIAIEKAIKSFEDQNKS